MAITIYEGKTWYPIRSGNYCPVCNSKKGRCSVLVDEKQQPVMYRCKYAISNRASGDGWYIHLVNPKLAQKNNNLINSDLIKEIISNKEIEITEELIELRDRVYRKFRQVFYSLNGSLLYKEDYENLIERGFTPDEINNIGFFSIPRNIKIQYENYSCQLKTAIVKELLKTFTEEQLIKVPGFTLIETKDKSFVTFKSTTRNSKGDIEDIKGYFIPYIGPTGKLEGMQYRLSTPFIDSKGKSIRYFWYSSKNVSCGSPIDYYIPSTIRNENYILITEGAIKGKFAASKLGIRSLSEAGITNYKNVIKALSKIEEIEDKEYGVLLALDMDKYQNPDVLSAEINTVSLLKTLGYDVTILEWNIEDGKGIDDKLNLNCKGFRFLNI
ncbi:DUF3854 domain-containing protein [Clostridium nigeriense]|uniref:DUF3854 domain-containing protein n=1 Tax=Clostridium nigeriense TaxID=1805470 RepID=UPI003D335B16